MERGELVVRRVDNGWLVRYGCVELAFTSEEHLVSEFARWARAPETVVKEYAERFRGKAMNTIAGGIAPPGAYGEGADMEAPHTLAEAPELARAREPMGERLRRR